jgi:ankyrin repeat protein
MQGSRYEINSENFEIFIQAVKSNDFETVKRMVEGGLALQIKFASDNSNPLHIASFAGHYKIADFLIEKNPDFLQGTMTNGLTPFHLASQQGHLNIAKLLLRKKPDLISMQSENGITALHLASLKGHLDVVKFLLEKEPDLISMQTRNGLTALQLASNKGHLDVVNFLMSSTNKFDSEEGQEEIKMESTPFGLGFYSKAKPKFNSEEKIERQFYDFGLSFCSEIETKLDSQAEIERKFSALRLDSSVEVKTESLRDSSSKKSVNDYWELCKRHRWEELKAMIKSDVNILFNHKNSEASMAMGGSSSEKTLFHRMVETGSLKALKILQEFSLPSHFRLTCNIEYKINEGDQKGELRGITALYLAIDKQRTEMVEFLVERSNLNTIVTKHQNDESELKEFSILEIALKKAESDKGLKILKIVTGENKTNKKVPLFRYEIGDERRKIELEKITKKFKPFRCGYRGFKKKLRTRI